MSTNLRCGPTAVFLIALFAPGAVFAQAIDCSAYENYAGAEPRGYAEACLHGVARPGGAGDAINAPTDTAFALDIGFVSDNAITHQQGDLATNVVVGASARPIFAMDAAMDLSVVYGIDNTTREFGSFDGTTLTVIAIVAGVPVADNISSLDINPATGEAYVTGLSAAGMTLYSFDLATGVATPIGEDAAVPLMIDTAINCEGVMYGHDIGSDQIFTIDLGTGAATPVGPTGVASNFAQGMDFDNDTGELYAYTYQGGGNNQYGTINLATGALTPININNPLGEFEGTSLTTCEGTGTGPARFEVNKDFDDDNTAGVEVTISCNTGLPLQQTTTIAENDNVTFVVNDFEDGTMDCEITEVVPAGYTASYAYGEETSDTGCSFVDVGLGSFHVCDITNTLEPVEIEVTKVWIDENEQFNAQNIAGATWTCSNISDVCDGVGGCDTSGFLNFDGNHDTESFFVFPDWDDGTTCSITEVDLFESGIEVDDSDCQGLVVFPDTGASCTIFNTRLYEGIPTLSQYGLGILAVLMLGVGFVAFRRMV